MTHTHTDIIIRALVDGQDAGLMLVPTNKTDNPDECIHYNQNRFEHVSTDGINPVTRKDLLELADKWTIAKVNDE